MMEPDRRADCDVAIVGGSVAGLPAALTLGRARWRVVVFDDGHPRNAPAAHVHNFLGQDAPTPGEFVGRWSSTGRTLRRHRRAGRIVDGRRVDEGG